MTTDRIPSAGWQIRDQSFAPAQMAAAQVLTGQLLETYPAIQLISLGGSLAAGLGHDYSDVDMDVVVDSFDDRQDLVDVDGVEIQVNSITCAEMDRMVELGTEFRVPTINSPGLESDERTLTRLVRLVIGVPLYVRRDFEPAYSLLSKDAVRKRIMIRDAFQGHALVEDALGAQGYGDWRTALTASATALGYAADAVLAASGDLYVNPKFLHRRLQRSPVTRKVADEIWDLACAGPVAGESGNVVDDAIGRRLWLTGFLFGAAMLDGWSACLASLPKFHHEGPGPRRDRKYLPLRSDSAFGLAGPDRGLELTEPIARLWWSLDGRPLAEIAGELRGRYEVFRNLDDAKLRLAVEKLITKGVAA